MATFSKIREKNCPAVKYSRRTYRRLRLKAQYLITIICKIALLSLLLTACSSMTFMLEDFSPLLVLEPWYVSGKRYPRTRGPLVKLCAPNVDGRGTKNQGTSTVEYFKPFRHDCICTIYKCPNAAAAKIQKFYFDGYIRCWRSEQCSKY